CARGINYVSYW
nr:immunoglobulin heavy chain junction region [Mus musculus]